MAALSITATNVVPVSSATNYFQDGISNAAITAGKACYYDSTTGLIGLFDGDSATVAIHTILGMAVSSAPASGSGIRVQIGGQCAIGVAMTKGLIYVGGFTAAGDINPSADLAAGQYMNILGMAISTSVLDIRPWSNVGGTSGGTVI